MAVLLLCFACDESDARKGDEADAQVPEAVRAADVALTAQVRDKLIACGLRERAEGERDDRSLVRDEYDRCVGRCNLDNACDALRLTTCDFSKENAFAACVAKCPGRPPDGFRCESGARIPHLAVCDGEEDCRQGEDEAECALTCDDGTPLASHDLFCDQNRDCADGSDEMDCLVCPDA